MNVAEILAEATVYQDDDGNPIVEIVTCGNCGRSWNDAAGSSITPAPSARCPYEMDDDNPCWEFGDAA